MVRPQIEVVGRPRLVAEHLGRTQLARPAERVRQMPGGELGRRRPLGGVRFE